MEIITFDEWKKVDIRVGTIIQVDEVEKSEKLYKCTVSFGEIGTRVIVSGIRPYIDKSEIVGKKVLYLLNLEPRMIMGIESQGMLVAVGGSNGDTFSFLVPEVGGVEEGAPVY